jgi:hypothetical protein
MAPKAAATIADVFGPRYASENYGVQYTAKGVSAIFAAWAAAPSPPGSARFE